MAFYTLKHMRRITETSVGSDVVRLVLDAEAVEVGEASTFDFMTRIASMAFTTGTGAELALGVITTDVLRYDAAGALITGLTTDTTGQGPWTSIFRYEFSSATTGVTSTREFVVPKDWRSQVPGSGVPPVSRIVAAFIEYTPPAGGGSFDLAHEITLVAR